LQRWRSYRRLHLLYTKLRASYFGLPNWTALFGNGFSQWTKTVNANSPDNGRILIATGAGGHLTSMTMESLLGVALTLRQSSVDFLLCDGALPACMMCESNWYSDLDLFVLDGPKDRCTQCHGPASRMLDRVGLNHLGFKSHLTESEIAQAEELARAIDVGEIKDFSIDGVGVGEHALAGALRFLARGTLENHPQHEALLRRYFEASLLTVYAARRIFQNNSYDVVVLNHGIYVPQGIVSELARKRGIRVVTWHLAYRKSCFIFNHDETYHHGLLSEPATNWDGMAWSKGHEQKIEQYLLSRWTGKQDWIKFHRNPELDIKKIENALGIDFSRPTIALLTNVVWDAQLHYRANAFPNMMDWVNKTIEYFSKRSELQLLIRVHPAELTGTVPSNQKVCDEINRVFPKLPSNVFVISPESNLSTYAAVTQCNAALIYGTKMGVELSAIGVPVIVAGEAWVRGKGVTFDANSEGEYFQLLDKLPLPSRLDEATRNRALKYAYHFFFRRMIPVNCLKPSCGWPPFRLKIDDISDLQPGKYKGLDVICDGILTGTPFIYPAERESHSDA
jgi:hypothetical protein